MPNIETAVLAAISNLETLARDKELLSKIETAAETISIALSKRLPVLVCGNGGSASDAMHISAELVGKFRLERPGLNVICLNSNVSALTAWANDKSFDTVFSRQVESHGAGNGVLIALSTSGNSINVLNAIEKAKSLGMTSILMTGEDGGKGASIADILINTPGSDAPSSQNVHVVVYHHICEAVERKTVELSIENGQAG